MAMESTIEYVLAVLPVSHQEESIQLRTRRTTRIPDRTTHGTIDHMPCISFACPSCSAAFLREIACDCLYRLAANAFATSECYIAFLASAP